jgi:hypothetical protein
MVVAFTFLVSVVVPKFRAAVVEVVSDWTVTFKAPGVVAPMEELSVVVFVPWMFRLKAPPEVLIAVAEATVPRFTLPVP